MTQPFQPFQFKPSLSLSPTTDSCVKQETLALIQRYSVDFVGEEELVKALDQNKRLIVKAGFDPTSPDLHLGHAVLLQLMAKLAKLGHLPFFIVGDYTALIGDPSGKNKLRPSLSPETIELNAQTYMDQAHILLQDGPLLMENNSLWLKGLSFSEVIKLAATQTVAQMLEREDFTQRYQKGTPISLHEFLYPLMQGYDSVAINADIELGGTDQTFNLLMGRTLQKTFGQKPQAIATLPLLVGLDGAKKMSKSLGNLVGITDEPDEMYGKVMSIPDTLILPYFKLVLDTPAQALEAFQAKLDQGENPKQIKMQLAHEITALFHNQDKASAAEAAFEKRFAKKEIDPDQLSTQRLEIEGETLGLASCMVQTGLAKSNSAAFRLIEGGAVKIDGQAIRERAYQLQANQTYLIQSGKLGLIKVFLVFP